MLADADFQLLVMLPGYSRPAKATNYIQTFHLESSPKKRRISIAEDKKVEVERAAGYERRVQESQETLDLKGNKKSLWSPAGSQRGIMTVILQSISSYAPRQLGLMKVGQLGNYIHSNEIRKRAKQILFISYLLDWQAGGEIVGICRGLAGKSANTRISFARCFLKGMK